MCCCGLVYCEYIAIVLRWMDLVFLVCRNECYFEACCSVALHIYILVQRERLCRDN